MLRKTISAISKGSFALPLILCAQFSTTVCTSMKHELSDLPFEKDALEPFISSETIDFHYGKHHQGYVNLLNDFIENNEGFSDMTILDIIKTESGKVYNLAAQIYNHEFFWNSLTPFNEGEAEPVGELAIAIEEQFGSFEDFRGQFQLTAASHFGSGWAWLVVDEDGKLEIMDTHDALNPITLGKTPLLTVDVWEHSYYIDYRNNRAEYLNTFWNYVNWEFANSNFMECK